MEASSLEKNLPDDNVGSDSTLGGFSPLSWCGIVSLAGVIAVCIGGVATHPLQAIRFVLRFIPADPGPAWSVVLCLVTIGCIVCMVPVWVPLCMVAGLIFGIPVGAAHNFVALWTGSTLSVVIGRYFFREPIRERLFDGDFPTSRRLLLILEDENHSLGYQICFRFLTIPLFVRNYGPSILDIPLWKICLGCVPHAIWVSVLFASLGDTFRSVAMLLREGHDVSADNIKWQSLLIFILSASVTMLLSTYLYMQFMKKLREEDSQVILQDTPPEEIPRMTSVA